MVKKNYPLYLDINDVELLKTHRVNISEVIRNMIRNYLHADMVNVVNDRDKLNASNRLNTELSLKLTDKTQEIEELKKKVLDLKLRLDKNKIQKRVNNEVTW